MRWKTSRYIAIAIFIIPWFFWIFALAHASNSGFIEDRYAIQIMVLGGAISMVAGAFFLSD